MSRQPDPRTADLPPLIDGARWIPLTQDRFALVDHDDYERLAVFSWHATVCNGVFYARRRDGQRHRFMHHEVRGSRERVDHRNGDGLDNRRQNLRACTAAQNNCNKRKRSKATSRYIGVCWDESRSLWQAGIRGAGGKRVFLGRFDDERSAALAYDAAAARIHGEFARLNFPQERAA